MTAAAGDPPLALRRATAADVPALQALIETSARALSVGFYGPRQIDAAVAHVFGVDTQLVADGTYWLVDAPDGPAACGGWSRRRTLYGGDQMKGADDPLLDPATDDARIRAFFVHPRWARRGLARRLYDRCAADAAAAGFRGLALVATLPGEPLYRALGFAPLERVTTRLPGADGGTVDVDFVHMRRDLDRATSTARPDHPAPEARMHVHGVTPILNVSSFAESVAWFERLGWTLSWSWGDPPDFGGVVAGPCQIFLCQDGQGGRGRSDVARTFGPDGSDAADRGVWMSLWVEDVDAVHAHCVEHGLEVTWPPTDMPWRVREMHVRHPDGHVFRVSRGL